MAGDIKQPLHREYAADVRAGNGAARVAQILDAVEANPGNRAVLAGLFGLAVATASELGPIEQVAFVDAFLAELSK